MEKASEKRREYSKSELVIGNLAIILWIGLGAVSCGLFYPLAALGYFALAAFLIFFELGKHGCVTCYYCKTCTIGIGKLPELFFRHGGTANINQKVLKLFPFVYILLSQVPVVLFVFSIIQELLVYKIGFLVALIVFSVYCGVIRRKILLP
jgi:hypothetical protein